MSIYYNLTNLSNWQQEPIFGKARNHQDRYRLEQNFDEEVLYYLSEKIINHLLDSVEIEKYCNEQWQNKFNDFSFVTAPAYKAFEGFLFQIAKDLNLQSSEESKFVGAFFDEKKVDETIDKLLEELEIKTEEEIKLKKDEKVFIKDMIKEMKRFLRHYRHTPAHFYGEPINTTEKAKQNIFSIYRIINETTKTLMQIPLIDIKDKLH